MFFCPHSVTAVAVLVSLVFCVGALAVQAPLLIDTQGDLAFPTEWRVYGPLKTTDDTRAEAAIDAEAFEDIPGQIAVVDQALKARLVKAPQGHFDFGVLFGGFEVHDVAYAVTSIDSPEAGALTLGVAADWWMQCWVNGELACETMAEGNVTWPLSVVDHVFTVPVRKGRNVLVVRVVSGSNSFSLQAGGPREIRAVQDELLAKRRASFAGMQASDVADPAAAPDLPRGHALLSVIGGERASQGPGNKIITRQGQTHVVWQDSFDLGYYARVRSLDHATGRWGKPVTLCKGVDDHSRPTMTMDSRGYLHVVMGGHNSPLQYRRSVRPNDASEWTEIEPFDPATYPVILCGPDDELRLIARNGKHTGMDWWSKKADEPWRHRGTLVGKDKRHTGYLGLNNALAWGPNRRTLHLTCGFFLGRKAEKGEYARQVSGTHQGIGYMRSRDGGVTWEKADGTPVPLPAYTTTIDLLEEGESDNPKPGIGHGGVAVDSQDRPYVVYVRHTPEPCAAHLKTCNANGDWRELPLKAFIDKQWPGWGMTGGHPVMTADDVLCIVATIVPVEHPNANWDPGLHGLPAFWLRSRPNLARVVWIESRDGGKTFVSRDVIPYAEDRGALMPTLERPTGFNVIEAGRLPSLLYFVGESRYTRAGETLDNDVFLVQPE